MPADEVIQPTVRPTRRTVLGAACLGVAGSLTGLVASGCSVPDVQRPGAQETPSAPELAPDLAVATEALAQLRLVRATAEQTAARFPATRARLATLIELHRTHEESLDAAVPERARATDPPAAPEISPQRPTALAHLQATEVQLQGALAGLALRAESGRFARLLGSMSAAVGQHLVGWPA